MPFCFSRRAIFALAGAVFLAAAVPAAAADEAIAFAKALYKLPKLWGNVIATPATRDQYLAPDLNAAVTENIKYSKDLDYAVDYDPLAQAQDWLLKNIKFTGTKSDSGETVRVDFANGGEATTVLLELTETDAGWRLADLHNAKGESLLQEYRDLNTGGRAVQAGN